MAMRPTDAGARTAARAERAVAPVIGDEFRWRHVYRLIADQIASGALRPGDRLQGERGLSATFGVGRATVRRALAELERDGAGGSAVAPGAPLFHLERVRLLDGLELALADTLIPVSVAPVIGDVDFSTASLYAELAARGA